MNEKLNDIVLQFDIPYSVKEIFPFGEGHINDTYIITTDSTFRYILQRINHQLFNVENLMGNIQKVTDYLTHQYLEEGLNPLAHVAMIIPTKSNQLYFFDDENYYRVFTYIEGGLTLQNASTKEEFYESAVAFAHFTKQLKDFDASSLKEILPKFHHTPTRYQHFLTAVNKNIVSRKNLIQEEIAWVIEHEYLADKISSLIETNQIPLRVTHNDTKLNNVILDEITHKALAVIDLDTVMPGSVCYDFGDSIRFGCNSASEDERDLSKVHFLIDYYQTYSEGYLRELKDTLTPLEIDTLPIGALVITFECGIRFLTDYLNGDTYFKISRPNQNLDRARTQFKLVDEMIEQYKQMKQIIKQYKE